MKRYQVTYEVKRDLQLFLHWDVREHLFDAMFWILSLLLGSMAFSLAQAVPQEANWFHSTLGDSTTPSWMHPSSTEDFLYKYVHTLSQAGVNSVHTGRHLIYNYDQVLWVSHLAPQNFQAQERKGHNRWILIFPFFPFLQLLVYLLHNNYLKTMTLTAPCSYFSWAFTQNPLCLWFLQTCDFKSSFKICKQNNK